LKIAHIIPSFLSDWGGLQNCVHHISEFHSQRGHKVVVFTPDFSKDGFRLSYSLNKIPSFKFMTKGYPISKYLISIYFLMIQKKYHFDLWQVNGGFPYGVLLVDLFKKYKIPCILRCSGYDIQVSEKFQYGVRRDKKIDRMIRNNYHKFNGLVAITNTVKQEYLAIGASENQIKYIPNGIDFERIFNYEVNENVRRIHNIPENAKIILTVGRNHPKKGHEMIPGILANILKKNSSVYWILIGGGCSSISGLNIPGKNRKKLITIEEIPVDLANNETPSGSLIDYYKQADVFAMTSRLETFGVVLIEAMAAGLPVVYFDAPGIKDIMKESCGIKCPLGDENIFTVSLLELLENSNRLIQLRKECIIYAKTYSWKMVCEEYLNLYKKLIKNCND